MKIQTSRFGEISIPEEKLIHLPDGILGFEQSHSYVLLEHDSEGTPFKWLQAADDPNLAFIVIDPNLVADNYSVQLDDEAARQIGCADASGEDFAMMAIVNIPKDEPIKMTVNLRAPILVHLSQRRGWQVILPDEAYPIRHRIFPDEADATDPENAGQSSRK